jgi:hypothetical protein
MDHEMSRSWRRGGSLSNMTVQTAPHVQRVEAAPPRTDVRVVAERVCVLVGRRLTAYLAGADSVSEFNAVVDGRLPDAAFAYLPRLELVLQVADMFRTAKSVTLLRAWLRDVDPDFKDRCPADLIRDAADEFVLHQLRASAEAYLRS